MTLSGMNSREFYDTVKAQRKACIEFANTHSPESRDRYFHLSDLIDAEIARVEKELEKNNGKGLDGK